MAEGINFFKETFKYLDNQKNKSKEIKIKMEFCPKCGAVLVQKKKNDGCPRCSYTSKSKIKLKTSEKIGEKPEIAIVKKDHKIMPIVTDKCPACGHDKAYFWTVQTRASDESETKFFKCIKCDNTRREYR